MIGVLTLFMGGFIIFNTFRTIVAERRHDIGMLRAIGASRRTIVGLILTEGLVQGVVGTAIGMALGYLLGVVITVGHVRHVPAAHEHPAGRAGGRAGAHRLSVVLGVGVTLLAGLLPALSAGRVTPMEVLRPSLGEAFSVSAASAPTTGAVMVVAGIWCACSAAVSRWSRWAGCSSWWGWCWWRRS